MFPNVGFERNELMIILFLTLQILFHRFLVGNIKRQNMLWPNNLFYRYQKNEHYRYKKFHFGKRRKTLDGNYVSQ